MGFHFLTGDILYDIEINPVKEISNFFSKCIIQKVPQDQKLLGFHGWYLDRVGGKFWHNGIGKIGIITGRT